MNAQQSHMHDLRKENFVTQGAFRAAQLCKADQGTVNSQRRKLDLVCRLLVSAGVLEEEEGHAGSLCFREHKEESKPAVVQQESADGNGNTVYLEECLARAEEEIARIEEASRTASDEARRATSMASNLRTQVDERCQQVQKECCDRLDESLEDSGERIETNSTRISHLAAEVEWLINLIKERGVAARPLGTACDKTAEAFPVEVADPPQQQATATIAPPPQPSVETERRQKRSSVRRRDKREPEEAKGTTAVRRSRENRNNPRPGVLGEPCSENGNRPEADGLRAAFLAASLQQAPSPPAWRRRHSTYIDRQVVSSRSKEDTVAAGLVFGPTRPQEDRPVDDQATPSSWARTWSWPLLAGEATAAAACRLHDVEGSEQANTDDDAANGGKGKHDSARGDTPNLELIPHGSARPEATEPISAELGTEGMPGYSPIVHRRPPAIGNHSDESLAGTRGRDETGQKSEQGGDLSEDLLAGDHSSTITSDHNKPSPSQQQPLARMTANEAAEALQGVTTPSLGRRDRDNTAEKHGGSVRSTDAAGMNEDFPGARLACLVDTPDLWCPRDTWDNVGAAELSSSEGSSTEVAEVAEGRGPASDLPHQDDGLASRQ